MLLTRHPSQLRRLWHYYVDLNHDEATRIAERVARYIVIQERFERLKAIGEAVRNA